MFKKSKLISRDEEEMVAARKRFYNKRTKKNKDLLNTGDWVGKKGIPLAVGFFCVAYCYLTAFLA